MRAILLETPSWQPVGAAAPSRGRISIVADAFDTPDAPSPRPVGPRCRWPLPTSPGASPRPTASVVAHNTAADFRYGEPPRRDFCSVYAPGTRQNFAAVDGRFHWGKAGRYLFDLTPRPIDTSRLPPGNYRITVTATDTAGNTAC